METPAVKHTTQDDDLLAAESNHQVSNDPFWQESWYFNFSDPKNNVWGLTRIGYRPNKNKADGLLLAFIDGDAAILYPPVGCELSDEENVTIDSPKLVRTKGLSYRCEATMACWRLITKNNSLDIDLNFEARTPMYMFPALAGENTKKPASDHYEQSGIVTGRIAYHGKQKVIEGTGQRDHSWGPRDWSGIGDWEWLSGQFESGWCFNFWAVGSGAERTVTGFVGYPEKNIAIIEGRIDWLGNPKKPMGAKVFLHLADGSSKVIDYFVKGHWPLYKDGATIMEMFCTYNCEGERGSGISEHLYADPKIWFKVPGMLWKYGRLARRCR